MRSILFLLMVLSILLFISCDEETTAPRPYEPVESRRSFTIKSTPDIGTQETLYKIELTEFSDTINLKHLKFRFDYESDGRFDTAWLDSTTVEFYPAGLQSQKLTVEMMEVNGDFKTVEQTIMIAELFKPFTNGLSRFMMESSWDPTSQFIYFTWMGQIDFHHLYRGDINSGEIVKMPIDPKYESCTHSNKISPDGNKFLFNISNVDNLLGIINIETGQVDTIKNMDQFTFEWGRNSNEILYVDASTRPYNWKLYNLETGSSQELLQISEEAKYYTAKFNNENELYVLRFVYDEGEVSGDIYLEVFNTDTKTITSSRYFGWKGDLNNDVEHAGITISDDGRWVFAGGANILYDTQNDKSYTIGPLQQNEGFTFENSLSPDGKKIAVASFRDDIWDPIYYIKLPEEIY